LIVNLLKWPGRKCKKEQADSDGNSIIGHTKGFVYHGRTEMFYGL
jgi:hypothetical protein